jgi:hypothetical protein
MTRLSSRFSWDTGKRIEEPPPWPSRRCDSRESHGLAADKATDCVESSGEENEFVSHTSLVAQSISTFVGSIRATLHSAVLSHTFDRVQQEAHEAAFRTVQEVIEFTQDLFRSPVVIRESHDPEYPREKKIVLTTEVAADNATMIALEHQWIQHVSRLAPHWPDVRLVLKRKK